MIISRLFLFFKRIFLKKPPTHINPFKNTSNPFGSTASDLTAPEYEREVQLNHAFEMMKIMSKTYSEPLPCAILQPRVPHDGVQAGDSWFGGAPRLPAEVKWPDVGGTPDTLSRKLI